MEQNSVNNRVKMARRESGKWSLGIGSCNNRLIPCGNPLCFDEIMRAVEMPDGYIDKIIRSNTISSLPGRLGCFFDGCTLSIVSCGEVCVEKAIQKSVEMIKSR
jgi:hypothetical protein